MSRDTKRVHVELDVTPDGWNPSDEGAVAAAIAAALATKIPISEVRASRSSLLVLTEVPADDVPIMGLVRRCGEIRAAVQSAVRI